MHNLAMVCLWTHHSGLKLSLIWGEMALHVVRLYLCGADMLHIGVFICWECNILLNKNEV